MGLADGFHKCLHGLLALVDTFQSLYGLPALADMFQSLYGLPALAEKVPPVSAWPSGLR